MTCSDCVVNLYPKNVYQVWETLSDKFWTFGLTYTGEQKLFTNLALSDFESLCIEDNIFVDTNTNTRIGKHIPISLTISSYFINEPFFLCISDPHYLVASSIGAIEGPASQSESQMKMIFLYIETTIIIGLGGIQEKLNQRKRQERTIEANVIQDECEDEKPPLLSFCRCKTITYLICKNI